VYNKEMKGLWGSVGMLPVCLLFACFFSPYWISALGAITATLAEKFGKTTKYTDDNLYIPLSSALVMALLHIYF
ncbi:unnamed protein product, partial [marine sediment metagenome]